nr:MULTISPECIES: PAS domain-containing protein [unclassified Methylobacterium]
MLHTLSRSELETEIVRLRAALGAAGIDAPGPDAEPTRSPRLNQDVTTVRRADAWRGGSEEFFGILLEQVETAFAIVEVAFDADDRPVDYRFVEANPAFEHQAGVNLRGKWVTEFAPNLERFWFDTYGRVARTGEPATFESYAEAFARWFDVRAIRVGDPSDRRIAIFFNDVTARKHAEEDLRRLNDALRRNEARQAGALRIAQLGTYEWDLATGAVVLDARSREIFGFAEGGGTTAQEVFGRIHPEDLPGIQAAASERVTTGEPLETDYRIRLPNGGTRIISSNGEFLPGANGRAGRGIGVFAEVTDRRRAEDALRESEARFRNMADHAPVMMWVTDAAGRCTYLNRSWYAFTGQTEAQAEGFGWLEATHPDDRAEAERVFLDANAGAAPFRVEYRLRRADGAYLWAIDAASPRFASDGAFLGYVGSVTDIDAQKRAQESLRGMNETLEVQVARRTAERDRSWRLSQELLVIAAPDGTLEAVNPSWTGLLGWEEGELLGRPFIDLTHPDDLEATLAAFAGIFERPLVTPYEYRLRHRDGTYRWFAWTGSFEDGRVYASGRHVTVERDQAEALRQSQKMEAVGQLTGGLAHDFNNLLAGIAGSLELMQTRLQQGRFNDVERYMAAAQGASKRAAALTHRLLAFSRRQTLDPKPTDVNRLVLGMQEMVQRTVGPGIPVEVVGAAGLWPALVDPPQLENALLNLCINARDAMPDGGRITIETANKWMDERAARQHDMPEGQYLSLCVTDTGTGMSPDIVAKVFEPFFTTKPIGAGTGLGLSMIYGFAKQSGGQVRIYSEIGEGTTVCIYLPRHYGEVEREDGSDGTVALPRSEQGETVLVVDDEPTVRMLVTDVLEDLGYASIEAGDSATGLKILQSDVRIDLLVTDVGLPGGMNGRQMADAARVSRSDLKVLFITGYAENAAVGNGHLAPGMAVLTKPFSVESMAARIRSIIAA